MAAISIAPETEIELRLDGNPYIENWKLYQPEQETYESIVLDFGSANRLFSARPVTKLSTSAIDRFSEG